MEDKNKPTANVRVYTLKMDRSLTPIDKMIIADDEKIRAASGTEHQTVLSPPLSFSVCYYLHENSSALRPCIDIYKTNIDGFGHQFPEKYTPDQVKKAIKHDMERETSAEETGAERTPPKEFETKIMKGKNGEIEWDKTVEARYEELRLDIDREHDELEHFFEYACPGQSFTDLCMNTREDMEITGNAFWETPRSQKTNMPLKIYPAVALNIALCPAGAPYPVTVKEQINALDFKAVTVMRRLRVYRQESEAGSASVYFKEFCDPRVVSADSGDVYDTNAAMQEAEGSSTYTVPEATELIHFKIYSGSGPYGIPRWLGAYKLIAGLIEKDQVDLDYYTDGMIAPMVIKVSGHTRKIGNDAIERITSAINDAKERKKAHVETLVIEAMSDSTGTSTITPKIEFENLMDARLKEATHLKYAEMCKEYIRQMFRLSKFLLGDTSDVNRSTSVSILEMAEMQIFEAERKAFDFFMNHVFFPEMDIRYHTFKSMGPQMEDLLGIAEALEKLGKSCFITPNEGRKHITDTTTLDVDETPEEWGKRPPDVTMSGRGYEPDPAGDKPGALTEFEREADQ